MRHQKHGWALLRNGTDGSKWLFGKCYFTKLMPNFLNGYSIAVWRTRRECRAALRDSKLRGTKVVKVKVTVEIV